MSKQGNNTSIVTNRKTLSFNQTPRNRIYTPRESQRYLELSAARFLIEEEAKKSDKRIASKIARSYKEINKKLKLQKVMVKEKTRNHLVINLESKWHRVWRAIISVASLISSFWYLQLAIHSAEMIKDLEWVDHCFMALFFSDIMLNFFV